MKKPNLTLIVAGVSVLVSIGSYFYHPRYSKPESAPKYSHVFLNKVCFKDEFAPGMTAEINYLGITKELEKTEESENHSFFEIPREALKNSSNITVWATDSKGNRSYPKNLLIKEGYIYTKN